MTDSQQIRSPSCDSSIITSPTSLGGPFTGLSSRTTKITDTKVVNASANSITGAFLHRCKSKLNNMYSMQIPHATQMPVAIYNPKRKSFTDQYNAVRLAAECSMRMPKIQIPIQSRYRRRHLQAWRWGLSTSSGSCQQPHRQRRSRMQCLRQYQWAAARVCRNSRGGSRQTRA